MTTFEVMYGECETDDTITPRAIRAHFCTDATLIQDGHFFMPTELVDGVQRYRIQTAEWDPTQEITTLCVSSEWYYRKDEKFVMGGKDPS